MNMFAASQGLMAQIQRFGQHHHAAAAAIGGIIRLVMLVQRIVPDVSRPNLDQALGLCTADDAFLHHTLDDTRE